MMRIAVSWLAISSFGLGSSFGAFAQPRNVTAEHWQAIDKSMSDLLLEGYRPFSVIAPSPTLRIYFLSSGSFLAKCSEAAALMRPPPPPPQLGPSAQQPASTQLPPPALGAAVSGPSNFVPEIGVTFECSRLSKSQ
jgi:hypothetical protein